MPNFDRDRSKGELERDIETKRQDMVQAIDQLQDAVREKLDYKKQARMRVLALKARVQREFRRRPQYFYGFGALVGLLVVVKLVRRVRGEGEDDEQDKELIILAPRRSLRGHQADWRDVRGRHLAR